MSPIVWDIVSTEDTDDGEIIARHTDPARAERDADFERDAIFWRLLEREEYMLGDPKTGEAANRMVRVEQKCIQIPTSTPKQD